MYQLCIDNDWGDPFSYARSREIYMAAVLGHTVAPTYSGADGIQPNGELAEYKSTIGKNINATYNGISVQPTWSEQKLYLIDSKICKYPNHYFARFDAGKIVELWVMEAPIVFCILKQKLKKKYDKLHTSKLKDPRLGATITMSEIHKYGTKLI